MNVIIDDVVKNNYLTPFNISREQVMETVINEDVKKVINFPDCIIILFLKKFDMHYLLVDGRWKPSSFSLLISSAFIVDQWLIKNLPIDNPLAVLEQFAKEFGYEIKVGDQKSKFIHDAKIEIPLESTMADFVKVMNDNISLSDNDQTMLGAIWETCLQDLRN